MMEVVRFLFVFCFDITTEIWIINSCLKLKTHLFWLGWHLHGFFSNSNASSCSNFIGKLRSAKNLVMHCLHPSPFSRKIMDLSEKKIRT